eukprot:scaffold1397_cov254-Pinguiococcus_pyrenoidosus.AAC.10
MALGLHYMHMNRVLHRDLKTQNIFLLGNGRLVLGDLGISKVLEGTTDFARTCIGTPFYMSPEIFKNKPYNHKSDIWALGCVLYELTTLNHAFDAASLNGLASKIIRGRYPQIHPRYSRYLRSLIDSMLDKSPSARPDLEDILRQPFIKRQIQNLFSDIVSRPASQIGEGTMAVRAAALQMVQDEPSVSSVSAASPEVQSLASQLTQLGLTDIISRALAPPESKLPREGMSDRSVKRLAREQKGALQREEERRQAVESALQKLRQEREARLQKRRARQAAGPPQVRRPGRRILNPQQSPPPRRPRAARYASHEQESHESAVSPTRAVVGRRGRRYSNEAIRGSRRGAEQRLEAERKRVRELDNWGAHKAQERDRRGDARAQERERQQAEFQKLREAKLELDRLEAERKAREQRKAQEAQKLAEEGRNERLHQKRRAQEGAEGKEPNPSETKSRAGRQASPRAPASEAEAGTRSNSQENGLDDVETLSPAERLRLRKERGRQQRDAEHLRKVRESEAARRQADREAQERAKRMYQPSQPMSYGAAPKQQQQQQQQQQPRADGEQQGLPPSRFGINRSPVGRGVSKSPTRGDSKGEKQHGREADSHLDAPFTDSSDVDSEQGLGADDNGSDLDVRPEANYSEDDDVIGIRQEELEAELLKSTRRCDELRKTLKATETYLGLHDDQHDVSDKYQRGDARVRSAEDDPRRRAFVGDLNEEDEDDDEGNDDDDDDDDDDDAEENEESCTNREPFRISLDIQPTELRRPRRSTATEDSGVKSGGRPVTPDVKPVPNDETCDVPPSKFERGAFSSDEGLYNVEDDDLMPESASRLSDRIRLLQRRCEEGLGQKVFQRAYEFLKRLDEEMIEEDVSNYDTVGEAVSAADKGDPVLQELTSILSEEKLYYWKLIDQLIFMKVSEHRNSAPKTRPGFA